MNNKFKKNNSQKKRHEGSEKRKVSRLKREITVQYKIKELPKSEKAQASVGSSVDITRTKDLSEGGMFFTASKIIPSQAILEIKLKLPTQREALSLEGRVVGCDAIEEKIIYGIRVVFFNLDHNQKVALRNFIQLFLKG